MKSVLRRTGGTCIARGTLTARARKLTLLVLFARRPLVVLMRPVVTFSRRHRFRAWMQFAVASTLVTVAALADTASNGIAEQPLAPRSGPRGATMFQAIPATASGIVVENSYNDPKMWWELYHEFEIGEIGTGVAIGDYDGDGLPDIFVVAKTDACHLFRNLGGFRFQDVTARAGLAESAADAAVWKQGVTFADVNNDGWLDIYICRFNAPNLLYINQGNGTFVEMAHAYGLDVKDASVMAAFCDYDRDGWLDVFIQTNLLDANGHPNGQRNYLFHNNRNGSFTNVTERAGIGGQAQGHSAIWWDYDNDGWPDLYVADDFAAPDKLYHNNRNGTFTNVLDQVVPHTPFSSMGSDLGDINNDGRIDFMVADMAATTHEKDQRGMVASRSQAKEPADGATEVPQLYRNAVYINTGVGRCLEAAFLAGLAATDWNWSLRFEDLDNDGRLDLFVTNGMHRESTNSDLISRQMAAENPTERMQIMRNSPVLSEPNLAFQNLGNLEFKEVGAAWGLDENAVSFGTAFGDLDGDGDLDLIYTNYQRGPTLLRNDSDTGHRVIIVLRGTLSNRYGIGAVVHLETAAGPQVRQLVLSRGILSSSEPIVHFGLGENTVIQSLTVDWPSGQSQHFTNLPVDRRFTISEPTAAPLPTAPLAPPPAQFTEVSHAVGLSFASREDSVDEAAQQRLLPVRLNRRGPALAVADLEGDGNEDIVIGGTTATPLHILQPGQNGIYNPRNFSPIAAATNVDDGPVIAFDANGDGAIDLLVTKGGSSMPAGGPEYQPILYINDGRGHFAPAIAGTLPSLSISAGAAIAADFDRDGHLDVFIGARVLPGQYPEIPSSALLANRGGKFEDVTDSLAPALRNVGLVTSALWSDVDGDGWLDLLVTLEWGPVKYFHNQAGKGFEDWTEKSGFASAGAGWWNSIAAADFNGDGRLDYVVGNLGLNTQYHADAAHPALLFYGDFKGDGAQPQIVEAYYEGEKLYPWRSRRDLGAAIPSLLRKFPSTNAYARATLNEILGAEKVAAADKYSATEFRSGVLLSQPDGSYRFAALPRIAQIAPIYGLAVGDFDGDGKADIYVVQNSFAPIPAVGRFDGGLSQFLRGDGHGNFSPVPAVESGLLVPGDAKALAVVDLGGDGWPDFVVTRNNDTSFAFRNSGAARRHSVCIRLKGPAGNPTAVGARITAEYKDGSTQTSEVYSGSGYYSQSTPEVFFGFSDSNAIRHFRVRWPNGQTTVHDASPPSPTVILKANGKR